jgi:hypothetical protein
MCLPFIPGIFKYDNLLGVIIIFRSRFQFDIRKILKEFNQGRSYFGGSEDPMTGDVGGTGTVTWAQEAPGPWSATFTLLRF